MHCAPHLWVWHGSAASLTGVGTSRGSAGLAVIHIVPRFAASLSTRAAASPATTAVPTTLDNWSISSCSGMQSSESPRGSTANSAQTMSAALRLLPQSRISVCGRGSVHACTRGARLKLCFSKSNESNPCFILAESALRVAQRYVVAVRLLNSLFAKAEHLIDIVRLLPGSWAESHHTI